MASLLPQHGKEGWHGPELEQVHAGSSALATRLELGAEGMGGGPACFLQGGALIGENGRNIQLIPKGPVGTLFLRTSASWAPILPRTGNWNQRVEGEEAPAD